jgi:hypothetical protein
VSPSTTAHIASTRLLLIFAVGAGAYAIGGSEEAGTLEVLLSNR